MSKSDILFWSGDGSSAKDNHVAAAAGKANGVPDSSVLTGDLDEIAAQIASGGSVEIPVLDRKEISYQRGTRKIERENVWGERSTGEQPVLHFEIPFTGEKDIFRLRPSTFDTAPPYAQVRQKSLIVTIVDSGDAEAVQREINGTLDHIDRYLGWHKTLWEGVGDQIRRQARDILANRKQRLEKNRASDDALSNLGFKPKP